SASKAQQLPGADSPAEIERKLARLEELEPRVVMLERMKLALESENEELKAAKPSKPSLIEALETVLDLAREAAPPHRSRHHWRHRRAVPGRRDRGLRHPGGGRLGRCRRARASCPRACTAPRDRRESTGDAEAGRRVRVQIRHRLRRAVCRHRNLRNPNAP